MAVVIALLVLALLSLLGITLMGLSVTESQIGSNEADLKKAFFAAEAGIQEAMYRMRLDPTAALPAGSDEDDTAYTATADPIVVGPVQGGAVTIPSPNPTSGTDFWHYNPAWSYSGSSSTGYGNYFGGTAANLDSAGRSFTSSGSAHAPGGALVSANITNTATDPRSYAVTVDPVVGFVSPCWQYVDQFGAPLVNPPLGSCEPPVTNRAKNPMFKVTSVGTAKSSQKVLSTMIQRFPINPQPDGALTANTNVNIQSAAAVIDGRNHDCNGNSPSSVDAVQAATAPSGPSGVSNNQDGNLICAAGTGDVCKGTSSTFPSTIGGLLLGPGATTDQIDALNAYLESIKVSPAQAPTSAFHGILYIDGNYEEPPDGSTGILIVHHRNPNGVNGCTNPGGCDVANLGNFNEGTFKGLIIADKINKINGNAQIIGSIFAFGSAADGVAVDDVSGTPTIKYSKCIMNDLPNLANFPFEVVKGTWHEQ